MQLSVIIVSYNVKFFLEQCLASVMQATEKLQAEVWVVDNASSDGSVEYLSPRFPTVQFIANTANAGFGKANNQALRRVVGKYVLFLNPDTIVAEDTFEKCISFLERESMSGALGVKMIDGSGQFLPESKRSFPDPLTAFYKLTGLSTLFPQSHTLGKYALAYLDENQHHAIDVICGAFMMCRKEILLKVNGFDEAFFMYGEDIDLSYRIQKAGYINWYCPDTTIIHFKGESSYKGSSRYIRIFYEAMIVFVKKHYRGGWSYLFAILFQAGIWLRAATAFVYYQLVKRLFSVGQNYPEIYDQCIIIGDDAHHEYGMQMVNKAGIPPEKVVAMAPPAKVLAQDLKQAMRAGHRPLLLFFQGTYTWKTLIGLLPQLPRPFAARFHGIGTGSFAGSESKDKPGEAIAKQ